MPGSDETDNGFSKPADTRVQLIRIAAALGCSPDVFQAGSAPPSELVEATELLRLWFAIEDPAARRTLLDQARKASGERR